MTGERVTESMLHEQIAKVAESLPSDLRERVMRDVDEAGAMTGTILLLEILRHLNIDGDDDLSEKARQAVQDRDNGA